MLENVVSGSLLDVSKNDATLLSYVKVGATVNASISYVPKVLFASTLLNNTLDDISKVYTPLRSSFVTNIFEFPEFCCVCNNVLFSTVLLSEDNAIFCIIFLLSVPVNTIL